MGTSTPELAVGIDATLLGNGALAVGDTAGTSTANVLLILALGALIHPLAPRLQTIRMDLPVMIVAAVPMLETALDGNLSRLDGTVLVPSGSSTRRRSYGLRGTRAGLSVSGLRRSSAARRGAGRAQPP